MNKLILSIIFMFTLSGCSMIPRMTFDTKNTVPQSTTKGKVKEICKGQAQWDSVGNITSCSQGYYNYEESYNKEERKMTIVERIKSFINNLAGWGFWIFLGLLIFAPGVLGFVFGKIIEGTVGVSGKALRSTVKAIKNAKRNGGKFTEELSKEHNKDKKVKKKINQLRAEEE